MNIEEELYTVLGSDNDVNAGSPQRVISVDLIKRTIQEIEFLRSIAGAVSQGESAADLKRRQGPQDTGQ